MLCPISFVMPTNGEVDCAITQAVKSWKKQVLRFGFPPQATDVLYRP